MLKIRFNVCLDISMCYGQVTTCAHTAKGVSPGICD